MATKKLHSAARAAWDLAARQHGLVTRAQLVDLGFSDAAIRHRLASGRLHRVARGVYAVGRPQLTRYGRWMAAVLACAPHAALSHSSAAALWRIAGERAIGIELSAPPGVFTRRKGLVLHRRTTLRADEITSCDGIAVTTPACTLIDIASTSTREALEAAINEAVKRDLTDPEALRATLDAIVPRPGVGVLRATLDRRTFRLTDSQLERRFLTIARRAGLPLPLTGRYVNCFKVDFLWPDLGLVVETDGLRYHRTAAQQARDHRRDQAHTAAGLTPLRFSHAQIHYEPQTVKATLAKVAGRLYTKPG